MGVGVDALIRHFVLKMRKNVLCKFLPSPSTECYRARSTYKTDRIFRGESRVLHDEIAQEETCSVFARRAVDQDAAPLGHLSFGEVIGFGEGGHANRIVTGERGRVGRQW